MPCNTLEISSSPNSTEKITGHKLLGNTEHRQVFCIARVSTPLALSDECYENSITDCKKLPLKGVLLVLLNLTSATYYRAHLDAAFYTGLVDICAPLLCGNACDSDSYPTRPYNAVFIFLKEVKSAPTAISPPSDSVSLSKGFVSESKEMAIVRESIVAAMERFLRCRKNNERLHSHVYGPPAPSSIPLSVDALLETLSSLSFSFPISGSLPLLCSARFSHLIAFIVFEVFCDEQDEPLETSRKTMVELDGESNETLGLK